MSRKAISEIVAALLLIAITIAGAIIVYFYSSGLLGSLQGAQPQQPYTNQIALEYYDWTATGTGDPTLRTIKVTLRNVGAGRGALADFFVSGSGFSTPVSLTAGNCPTVTTTVTTTAGTAIITMRPLFPQNSCTAILTIPDTVTITAGIAYAVKVVTKDGSVFTYSCIAGRSSGSLS